MTELLAHLSDRDWMPPQPWACPAGTLVINSRASREGWLEQRRTGIGASDVAAIFGVSRWATAWDVWADKTGRVQAPAESEAQRRGRLLEDGVADLWAATLPEHAPVRLRRAGLMRSRRWSFMLATVDRLSVCRAGKCVTELKTGVSLEEWQGDEIPVAYQLQTQQQLAVTGRDHAHVVVLGPRFEIVDRVVPRDDELIARMAQHLGDWWMRHVIDGAEPEASSGAEDGLARLYGDPDPDAVCELPTALWSAPVEIRQLAAQIKDLEARRADLVARVKQAAGNASVIKAAGERIATWAPSKRIAGADARWRKANPALAAQYTSTESVDVLDVDALVADHPELIGDGAQLYRVRTFRLVD